MAKKKKEPRPNWPVPGGAYVACPKGHNTVRLAEGTDPFGKYLDVWCTTQGCVPKERIRPEDTK